MASPEIRALPNPPTAVTLQIQALELAKATTYRQLLSSIVTALKAAIGPTLMATFLTEYNLLRCSWAEIIGELMQTFLLSEAGRRSFDDRGTALLNLSSHETQASARIKINMLSRHFMDCATIFANPKSEPDKRERLRSFIAGNPAAVKAMEMYVRTFPRLDQRSYAASTAAILQDLASIDLNPPPSMAYSARTPPPQDVKDNRIALLEAQVIALQVAAAATKPPKDTKTPGQRQRGPALSTGQYCAYHRTGYHAGKDCTVMLADPARYADLMSEKAPPGFKKR